MEVSVSTAEFISDAIANPSWWGGAGGEFPEDPGGGRKTPVPGSGNLGGENPSSDLVIWTKSELRSGAWFEDPQEKLLILEEDQRERKKPIYAETRPPPTPLLHEATGRSA